MHTSKDQSPEETSTTTLHLVNWGNRHKTTGGKKRTKYAHMSTAPVMTSASCDGTQEYEWHSFNL